MQHSAVYVYMLRYAKGLKKLNRKYWDNFDKAGENFTASQQLLTLGNVWNTTNDDRYQLLNSLRGAYLMGVSQKYSNHLVNLQWARQINSTDPSAKTKTKQLLVLWSS